MDSTPTLFRMRRQLSPLGALPVQHSPVWTSVHAHGLVPSLGGLPQAEVAHNSTQCMAPSSSLGPSL